MVAGAASRIDAGTAQQSATKQRRQSVASRLRRSLTSMYAWSVRMWVSFLAMSDPKIPAPRRDASASRAGRADPVIPRPIRVLGRAPAFGLSGLLPRRNAHAACMLFLALCALSAPAAGAPPEPGEAMRAYRAVDAWVRGWEVTGQGAQTDEAPGVHLACVTVRLDGRVLGRGAALRSEDGVASPHAQAARRAISRSRASLRAGLDGEEPRWDDLSRRITIGLELGGEPAPISDAAARSAMLGTSPGVHAIVARLGDRWGMMTPDEQITRGVTGRDALAALASALADDGGLLVAPIDEILALDLTLARARTVWIAQPRQGLGGTFLDRGGRFVTPGEIASGRLGAIAGDLASALRAHRWPGSERYGLAGTRDAVSGRCTPRIAPVFEQGLAVAALARHGAAKGDRASAGLAAALMSELSIVEPGEPEPWADAVSSASVIIALRELERAGTPIGPELSELEARCAGAVERAFDAGSFAPGVPPSARGLVAWAMVRLGDPRAERAVRRAYSGTAPERLVTQMPFLGWAELELAGDADAVKARDALVRMRELMWAHQIRRGDVEPHDRDLRGGIVFTGARNPEPTSGVLRPVAFACTMLGDERLTPGQLGDPALSAQIARLADAMRFVRQLSFDPSSAFLSALPEACVGGVRRSLWDWRIAPSDTALALLGVLEFERSLGAISARRESP